MTYDHITNTAETDAGMSNRDRVAFHIFNPNGIYRKWRDVCDRISAAVAAGKVKSGWIIAYGSLNHYASDQLWALLRLRRVGKNKLRRVVGSLQDNIDTAEAKLATIEG